MTKKQNPDHKKELHRINRIQGQLDGVYKMIEEKRYCPEILVQTRAVTAAVKSLEATILEKHLNHCVKEAFSNSSSKESEAKIQEIVKLFRNS